MISTRHRHRGLLLALAVGLCTGSMAVAQLRVVTWNVSNYSGGRTTDIQNVAYGTFENRAMAPDIILGQEFLSAAALTAFQTALNTAPGSPGDWAAAPWISGPDTISVCLYRTSKVTLLESVIISTGGSAPNPPRNTPRYKFRLNGYAADQAVLCCYSSHMKAGTASADQSRRLTEAQRIRADAEALNPAYTFILGGDFNIQSAGEAAYQALVASQTNNTGRFFDPIDAPGTWYTNPAFRFVHTQDPVLAGGGMDDRFDQLLVSGRLLDGVGFDYIGDPTIAYSETTWDDSHHSYRAWGNDGTCYNSGLTVTGNTMVGPVIAQAIINCAAGAGHIPVFLDLRVPPRLDATPTTLDFGQVTQGAVASLPLTVSNAGDTALWTAAGIADLHYSLAASAGFTAPAGPFAEGAAPGGNEHTITLDTSTVGPQNGTLVITSDAPDQPAVAIALVGEVVPAGCRGDLNCDGRVDFADIDYLVAAIPDNQAGWAALYASRHGGQLPPCPFSNCDVNGDSRVNFGDIDPFVALIPSECP